MNTWLPYVLTGGVSFVVGFTLGLLTHLLAFRKDRCDRLREFRSTLAVLMDKFTVAPNVDLISIHQQSIAKFRESVARIIEDIRPWRRYDFRRAFTAYCGMNEQDIRNYDPSHITHSLFPDTEPPKTKNIENWYIGRQKILDLLYKLRDLSW